MKNLSWILACAGCCLFGGCGYGGGEGPRCGNDRREGDEVCDGADLGGMTCARLSLGSGTLECAEDCGRFVVSSCSVAPECGNMIREGNEVCDGSDFGGLTCESFGFTGGDLRCEACLRIDASDCSGGCTPDCGGRECGPDPVCGVSCGSCGRGVCNLDGECIVTQGPCVEGTAGSCYGPDLEWNGTLCCSDMEWTGARCCLTPEYLYCQDESVGTCDGADKEWTGTLCCYK